MIKNGAACALYLLFSLTVAAQLPTLYPSRIKDKYGYVDGSNQVKLKYIFDRADPFNEGYAFVQSDNWGGYVRENGTWSFYDTTIMDGEKMTQGLAVVRKSDNWGVLDSNGKTVVPFDYYLVSRYASSRMFVAYKKMYEGNVLKNVIHLYNYKGWKVGADFDEVSAQADACVIGMKKDGRYWLYGKDAQSLLGYQVDDLYSLSHGARIKINERYGALNRYGQLVLPVRYKNITISEWQPYANYQTETTDTTAYFDLDNGRQLFVFRGILPQPFSDNVAVISYINNLHNVHDLTGRRIAQLVTYEDTSRSKQREYVTTTFRMHYSEGIIPIRHADKKWYAYDKQGKQVFQKGYEVSFEFGQGVAIVRTNGYSFQYGLIDKSGRELLPLEYSSVRYTEEPGVLIFEKDNKSGLIKTDGTIIYPLNPIRISSSGNGFFFITGNYSLNYKPYGYFNARTGYNYFNTTD